MKTYQLYIDGAWSDPRSGKWMETVNPYTGEAWARIPRAGNADVDAAVEAAHNAFRQGEWPELNATRRG
ncbi:MAG: aldehyde dehydrogenase family protein, partial [Gammaproteobacteria bacterium]|nr:aldehyde dehydrogenase family protein [Gammaproteobacteria bacterium]